MTKEPWRSLPPSVADLIEPDLEATTDEILATIAREVPEYARPLEGNFGRNVRTGVTEALRQFVELIRSPSGARGPGREVYVALGRGELSEGRTLDALQSAYRVGARVAWRRSAEAARAAGLDAEVLSLLAESIFAYIEELSADSVEGYSEARSRVEGERRRRERELVLLLLRDHPPAEEADLRAAAAGAGWTLPRTAAAIACGEEDLDRLSRRMPAETLAAPIETLGCAILPDPDGPGRRAEVDSLTANATPTAPFAIGPTVPIAELPASWALAKATRLAAEAGALGRAPQASAPPDAGASRSAGPLRADDVVVDLLLFQERPLVDRLAARRLSSLDDLTPSGRRRMVETAYAYVRERGNAAAMARALGLHAQTVRYRLARLRELLGDQLDDPDARLELELALRAQRFREPT